MKEVNSTPVNPIAGLHHYAGDCPDCGQGILSENGRLPECCPTCNHSLRSAKPDSPLHNIHRCLKLYCDTRGRSTRREFWAFTLAALLLLAIEATLYAYCYRNGALGDIPAWLWLVLPALLLCPFTTLTVRRLHDLDKGPGLMITFLALGLAGISIIAMHSSHFMPELITDEVSRWARVALQLDIIVGSIILYLGTQHRVPGPNEYGPAPK